MNPHRDREERGMSADPLGSEHECERCSGRGEHEVCYPDRDGNYDTTPCHPCGGTGWLDGVADD